MILEETFPLMNLFGGIYTAKSAVLIVDGTGAGHGTAHFALF
jgi:hypothetical protein